MSKISAIVVGDSLSPQNHRLTSLLVTFPRIILAELNTHRILSKNTASSRAIPFKKMIKSVEEDPFIPIAWQEEHKGMQGTKYLDEQESNYAKASWLRAKDYAISSASQLYQNSLYRNCNGVTKQICNRLLEPFMWVTALISGTEWKNFFELRCPQYELGLETYRSKKDAINAKWDDVESDLVNKGFLSAYTLLDWLELNKGQAEIHMMALAEAIWDAMNESKPKQLKGGDWHIVFEDKIFESQWFNRDVSMSSITPNMVKIATSMGARTSYTVVGDEKEINYERMIELHDEMVVAKPFHASPFEHNARAMSNFEYVTYAKTFPSTSLMKTLETNNECNRQKGWCRNFRGFIQYRHIIETGGTI